MKYGKKLMTTLILTVLLSMMMAVSAWAAQEDKLFLILCLDADEQPVGICSAFIVNVEGDRYVQTGTDCLSDEMEYYFLFSVSDELVAELNYAGSNEGLGFSLFEITDVVDQEMIESGTVELGGAHKGDIVNLVYWYYSEEIKAEGIKATLTEANDTEVSGVKSVFLDYEMDKRMEDGYELPAALIDDDGHMVGFYTSNVGTVFSFWFDSDYFYSKGSGSEETEPTQPEETEPTQPETTIHEETESSSPETLPGRTDPSSETGTDDPVPPIPDINIAEFICGLAAAVVVILIILAVLNVRSKKKKEQSAQVSVTEPMPHKTPVEKPSPESTTEFFADSKEYVPGPVPPVPVKVLQIKIEAIGGEMSGRRYSIGKDGVTFGRDSAAGIRFSRDTKGVSRQHCRIFWDEQDQVMLMDCGSAYGTVLKGYGKLTPQKPVPIKSGDVFCLGSEKNSFRVC